MGCNFMHTETFEQIIINRDLIDNSDLMKEGQVVEVMFHTEKETVLSAELPPIIDMEVTYTEPGVKGDTASTNSLKPATVETGATIKVPLFIQTGEKIRVDTRTREYYERIKYLPFIKSIPEPFPLGSGFFVLPYSPMAGIFPASVLFVCCRTFLNGSGRDYLRRSRAGTTGWGSSKSTGGSLLISERTCAARRTT